MPDYSYGRECVPNLVGDRATTDVCNTTPQGWNLVDLYKQNAPSIVKINNYRADGGGTASGFFVNRAGEIATDYHCVEGAKSITVETSDGHTYPAVVRATDPSRDLAIIQAVTNNPNQQFRPVTLSNHADPGESVAVLGHPHGSTNIVASTGRVSGLVQYKDVTMRDRDRNQNPYRWMLDVDMWCAPGNSGSPLFDTDGHVIGVVDKAGSGTTGATPIRDVMNLLDRSHARMRTHQ